MLLYDADIGVDRDNEFDDYDVLDLDVDIEVLTVIDIGVDSDVDDHVVLDFEVDMGLVTAIGLG